jgi:1,4-dihydroxy-6-naphthoate synthase
VQDKYRLLNSGGALGKGVGPLLIAGKPIPLEEVNSCSIAIPGKNTTAHFLFSRSFPEATTKHFMVFDQIEQAVLSGNVDAGVIIHENRFTYQEKGLIKLLDLGEAWEEQTGLPIPLGGIIAHQRIETTIAEQIDQLIRKSVEFAFLNYPELPPYVRAHAQEMSEDVMRQHIDLYVNDFSLNIGTNGRKAIDYLLNISKIM